MTIMGTIFWSTTYSFFTYNIAKLLGYQDETLKALTFTGLVLGAIRGLYGEKLLINICL